MFDLERQRPRILCAAFEALGLLQHDGSKIIILVGLAHAMAFTEDVPKFVVDDLDAIIGKCILIG
jgi:hypothetical protein